MKIDTSIFRAYDIRGTYPDQLNEDVAHRVAMAFAKKLKPRKVVIGRDLRKASKKMEKSVKEALVLSGVDVYDAGQMTNPMMGFAVSHYKFDGGIILSASHNPIGYGGLKMFQKNAVTIPGEDAEIQQFTLDGTDGDSGKRGKIEQIEISDDYIKMIRSTVDCLNLKPMKILLDPMFGSVNLILKQVLEGLSCEPIFLHDTADELFGGLLEPNPLNPEIMKEALSLAKKKRPDFGVMWDGDGDRVFFIDERGYFINAPYITAVLAEYILKNKPGSKIVGDTRIIWPIKKAVEENGGIFIESKSGYRFLKEKMMENDAPFAAEMTAHYFFEETKNMDNGIIPFLMLWKLLSEKRCTISELVAPYKNGHFMIDEIKKEIKDIKSVFSAIKDNYRGNEISYLDGLSVISDQFRFNIRSSNTEPVIKLNIEAKQEHVLNDEKEKILKILQKID